ncbi:MAG: TldD/PmbA family protein [Deltaproteobacteria bacterium]|nr:TldD/PmbA family protein [Deltaproteobacteria bacterium]
MRQGATYAEARVIRRTTEGVAVLDRVVQPVRSNADLGFGVRVLVNGAWGFAASQLVTPDEVERVARLAVSGGRVAAAFRERPVEFRPAKACRAQWKTPIEIDPLSVSQKEKVELLLSYQELAFREPCVTNMMFDVYSVREERHFASSESCYVDQELYYVWPSFLLVSIDEETGEPIQRASDTHAAAKGWEHVQELDIPGHIEHLTAQLKEKLSASPVEPRRRALVLDSSNLQLTLHETIGHAVELDLALGGDAQSASATYCTLDRLDTLRLGSKLVNVTADRSTPGALSTCGFDDEGYPTETFSVVREGLFVGYATSASHALEARGQRPRGCAYAATWADVPMLRVPNLTLAAGPDPVSVEDLIAATDDGIYLAGAGSFSIDEQRGNGQFGGQVAWEIKRGKLTRMLRDVGYRCSSLEFWNSCTVLGGPATWTMGGTLMCGKGDPAQYCPSGHGAPAARFDNIDVFNTRAE